MYLQQHVTREQRVQLLAGGGDLRVPAATRQTREQRAQLLASGGDLRVPAATRQP